MLIRADARQLPLIDGCVDCVVTSPPYWGLRDYGAMKQIGMERNPEAYIAGLVAVFADVRRVLKAEGTCWVNLGDSYVGSGMTGGTASEEGSAKRQDRMFHGNRRDTVVGFKPKDLTGIPWMFAFAAREAGWYLRSDIIWSKPNPMPESVTDRPTKAHEYLFLLTKSERYYYDAAAIAERSVDPESINGRNKRNMDAFTQADPNGHARSRVSLASIPVGKTYETRNKRSVWTINTRPNSLRHFATMPEALVEPCILAGCPMAGKRCDCDEVIDTPLGTGPISDPSKQTGRAGFNRPRRSDGGTRPITRREQRDYAEQMKVSPHRAEMATAAGEAFAHYIRTDTSGARPLPPDLLREWRAHDWLHEPAPCGHPVEPAGLVLDPFVGSGTVVAVAQRLGRRGVGVDLAYHDLSKVRTAQRGIPFTEASA